MVIFHSYVSLPEGILFGIPIIVYFNGIYIHLNGNIYISNVRNELIVCFLGLNIELTIYLKYV
jgi:hypothetical protein